MLSIPVLFSAMCNAVASLKPITHLGWRRILPNDRRLSSCDAPQPPRAMNMAFMPGESIMRCSSDALSSSVPPYLPSAEQRFVALTTVSPHDSSTLMPGSILSGQALFDALHTATVSPTCRYGGRMCCIGRQLCWALMLYVMLTFSYPSALKILVN